MKKSSILKIKTIPEIKEIAKKKIFYKTWNWLECGSA